MRKYPPRTVYIEVYSDDQQKITTKKNVDRFIELVKILSKVWEEEDDIITVVIKMRRTDRNIF